MSSSSSLAARAARIVLTNVAPSFSRPPNASSTRQRSVAEHDGHRSAPGQGHEIGAARVDLFSAHLEPGAPRRTHSVRLLGHKHGETDPLPGKGREVSKSTAVSGSHMPSGAKPKRALKSAIPQATRISRSSGSARGRMTWTAGEASAAPLGWPLARLAAARTTVSTSAHWQRASCAVSSRRQS